MSEGDRVELVATSDPYTTLTAGDRGTVTSIDTIPAEITGGRPQRQIWVDWDSGPTLALLEGEDEWRVVNQSTHD